MLPILENVVNTIETEETLNDLNYGLLKEKILTNLDFFANELKTPEKKYINSLKEEFEMFGIKRIRIIQLVKELLKQNDEKVNSALLESNIIRISFDLIFEFQWNNQFHCLIEEIFLLLIKNQNEVLLEQVNK